MSFALTMSAIPDGLSALYDSNSPGYDEKTGHFTQVGPAISKSTSVPKLIPPTQIVWKETTQIGCAAAPCTSGMPFNSDGQVSSRH